MSDDSLRIIASVLNLALTLYIYTGLMLEVGRVFRMPGVIRKVFTFIWRWSKWPGLVYIIVDIPLQIFLREKIDGWDYLLTLMSVIVWWYYRNHGDDDPWDKIKKKAKETVQRFRGRLVVVPA